MKNKILVLLCLYCFGYSPFSQSKSDCLSLHVIQNAPLGYYDEQHNLVGMHTEILQELALHSEICISIHLMPYARIWKSIQDGDHDGGIVFRSPRREHLVNYVGLIANFQTVVIPRSYQTISRYSDLNGLLIGKTRGTRLSDKFDSDLNLVTLDVTNYGQAIQMLDKGRIDAIAGSALVLSYQLTQANVPVSSIDPTNKFVLGSRQQWLQLSKKANVDVDRVQLAESIQELTYNGTLDSIMEKYYGPNWREVNE